MGLQEKRDGKRQKKKFEGTMAFRNNGETACQV
jgi:hypothetical protein